MPEKQNIYLIGIKGVGMTMLAQFLASKGNKVSGSDINDTFLTDKVLRSKKIKIATPFNSRNIPEQVDLIIYSTAYNEKNNPEMTFIKNNPKRFKHIRVLSYPEALGEIFNKYYGLAVCGSHGKTTTSAWLGYVLWKSAKEPNVLVGSRVPQFRGSSLVGKSKYFVAEVDEYQNKLKYFQPQAVVLNNIDYDHPDFFKNPAAYTKAFADFIKKIPSSGFLVISRHDRETQKIKKYCRGRIINYGLKTLSSNHKTENAKKQNSSNETYYSAADITIKNGYQVFKVSDGNNDLGEFRISLWGEHNILNALAVIATARELKVSVPLIKKHLAGFRGTERRAQILGKYHGALIIDDYAHHPTEINATLKGLREHYHDKRIITVFHPHTFTRTKAFFTDFVKSFKDTNELIILDIYGSAREKQGGISSRQLAEGIVKFNQKENLGFRQEVKHIATMPETASYLRDKLKAGDVLLLMGAGDVFRIADELLK